MSKPDPKRRDRSDEPTGRLSLAGWARPVGHLEGVHVRTGSSNADAIQFCHRTSDDSFSISPATGVAFSQSERDLAVPEAAGRRAEGRASGKSDGKRSDRSETSCGWRGVAAALHAEEGQTHE